MTPQEQTQLLALFDGHSAWCQQAEARDRLGNAVRYDDSEAVAWDVTGGLCHLFGWKRACVLFEQLDRHIQQKKHVAAYNEDPSVAAMAALQDYNDRTETTCTAVVDAIRSMPVWRGTVRRKDADGPPACGTV